MKGESSNPSHGQPISTAVLLVLSITGTIAFGRTDPAVANTEEDVWFPSTCVLLRIRDGGGQPVAGAKAGPAAQLRRRPSDGALMWSHAGLSDDTGHVALNVRSICRPKPKPGPDAVYVLHEGRRLGALVKVTPSEAGKMLDVRLRPLCQVRGAFGSAHLKTVRMPLHETEYRVYWRGCRVLTGDDKRHELVLSLPSGQYALEAHGIGFRERHRGLIARCRQEMSPFSVRAGQRASDLGVVELCPTKLSALIGQTAPKLGPSVTWVNGKPVELARLRGHAVVLYLGGRFPTPARGLSQLLELHSAFGNGRLSIIAIYDCDSREELERNWRRTEMPGGIHEMPFRVAIDAPSGDQTAGVTHRRYADDPYRAHAVLIDATGKVAGELRLGYSKGLIVEAVKDTIDTMLEGREPRQRGGN